MTIFLQTAPRLWAAGLNVIPLEQCSKSPVTQGWSRYATEEIPPEVQQEWLGRYPNGNIGLCLGEKSGLVALDIDTDDINVINLVTKLLPHSPWVRVGKKGFVKLYRWQGHKTARIRTAAGKSLLEILSGGTQVVLPPSIHPETREPYKANCDLVEVLDQIPLMPRQAEILIRQALLEEGIELSTKGYTKVIEYISVGARDSKMVAMAGLLAKGVSRGERNLYEAVQEMRAWVENFVEKVAGDNVDPENAVGKLIEFLKRDVAAGRVLPAGWDDDLSAEEAVKFRTELGVIHEKWDIDKTLGFLEEQFALHDRVAGAKQRREAVDTALSQVATSPMITPMDHDQIFNFINTCTGKMISIGACRKRLAQLSKTDTTGDNHAEIAEIIIKEITQYGELRFDAGHFWQYRGSHWEEVPEHELRSRIIRDYGSMDAAKRSSDHTGILRTIQSLVTKELQMSSIRGLNFANGFLTSDLQLKPHNPDFGSTYVLPFVYDLARATGAQRFFSFLNQSWGDDEDYAEKVQALREAMAVTLFGLASQFQKAFCAFGIPFTGKSVLLEIIRGILPPEATCQVAPDMWADKFLPTQMVGKLVNFCGELSEHSAIPGDRFKYIVDGGEIPGQLKGQQIFTFKPYCAHWFASNHLPRTRDSSAGFSRRWMFFHFTKVVRPEDRVLGLANDIAAEERDAIVAWAAQALPDLMRAQNYTSPDSHEDIIGEMAGINNSVRFFFLGGPVKIEPATSGKPLALTSEISLHSAYWSFCKMQAGARPVSLKIFRQRAMELATDLGFGIKMDPHRDQANYTNVTLVAGQE